MLGTINKLVDNPTATADVICPECGEEWEEDDFEVDCDLLDYTKWLEEQLEAALSVGDRLLQSHNALLENEK